MSLRERWRVRTWRSLIDLVLVVKTVNLPPVRRSFAPCRVAAERYLRSLNQMNMIKITFIYLALAATVYSQNRVVGTYYYDSPFGYATLILNNDSTFEYSADVPIRGTWTFRNDTISIRSYDDILRLPGSIYAGKLNMTFKFRNNLLIRILEETEGRLVFKKKSD